MGGTIIFRPTSLKPFFSKRAMISPTCPGWTPAGLTARKVLSRGIAKGIVGNGLWAWNRSSPRYFGCSLLFLAGYWWFSAFTQVFRFAALSAAFMYSPPRSLIRVENMSFLKSIYDRINVNSVPVSVFL